MTAEVVDRLQRIEQHYECAGSFAELLDGIADPVVRGPDQDGEVWLSGALEGLCSALNLTIAKPEFVQEALDWRAHVSPSR